MTNRKRADVYLNTKENGDYNGLVIVISERDAATDGFTETTRKVINEHFVEDIRGRFAFDSGRAHWYACDFLHVNKSAYHISQEVTDFYKTLF